VTGKQVLEFCINKGYIVIPKDDIGVYLKKEYATAYRTMRRWLERNNYKRGKRSGNIKMKEHVAIKRDLYLSAFFANQALPAQERLREVYLDESYIHQHYKKDADSIWDPNDDQDLQVGKLPNKGNRYCFLCAIQGPNPRVFDYSDIVKDEEARLMDKLTLVDLIPTDRGGVVEKSV